MPVDIRRILHEAAPRPLGNLDMDDIRSRGRRVRPRTQAVVTILALGSVVALVVLAAALVSPSQESRDRAVAPAQEPEGPTGCRSVDPVERNHGAYGTFVRRADAPPEQIAAGTHRGLRWTFCAYTATQRIDDETPERTLCEEFRYGPGPQTGYACLGGELGTPPGAVLFSPTGGPRRAEGTYYFGGISDRVDRVVARTEGQPDVEASIYDPPPSVEVDYRFYLAFVDSGVKPTILALDGSGTVIGRQDWDDG